MAWKWVWGGASELKVNRINTDLYPLHAGLVTAMQGFYFPNENNAPHHGMQKPKKGSLKFGEVSFVISADTAPGYHAGPRGTQSAEQGAEGWQAELLGEAL